MRDARAGRFLGFMVPVGLLALGGVAGLVLGVLLGGVAGWGVLVLPLALVAGMAGWGAVAFVASLVRAARERSLSSLLRPVPDAPGAFCLPVACVLAGPLLGLSLGAGWVGLAAAMVTATAYGGLAYGLARTGWLEPSSIEGGEP